MNKYYVTISEDEQGGNFITTTKNSQTTFTPFMILFECSQRIMRYKLYNGVLTSNIYMSEKGYSIVRDTEQQVEDALIERKEENRILDIEENFAREYSPIIFDSFANKYISYKADLCLSMNLSFDILYNIYKNKVGIGIDEFLNVDLKSENGYIGATHIVLTTFPGFIDKTVSLGKEISSYIDEVKSGKDYISSFFNLHQRYCEYAQEAYDKFMEVI